MHRSLSRAIDSHDNNYTLLRTILAAAVIYFHSFPLSGSQSTDHVTSALLPITSVGGLAVQSFFFLSGLFVAQSFSRDPRVFAFIVKRALRIWPGYFVCLVVTAVIACAVSSPSNLPRFLVFNGLYDYILRNAVFDLTWTIDGVFTDLPNPGINGSIHTLPLEAKMYAILAVLGAFGMTRRSFFAVIGGAAAIAAFFIPGAMDLLPWKILDAHYSRTAATMFMAGVICFGLARWIEPRLWQGAALAILTGFTSGEVHVIAFYLTVMWALIYLGQVPTFWKPRNDLSYGIYLYGFPCQQFIMTYYSGSNPYVLTVLAIGLASLFAWASWRLVESPAIRFGKHVTKPWSRETLYALKPVGAVGLTLILCLSMQRIAISNEFAPVMPMDAAIVNYGPHESKAGAPINQQADGQSAIWLAIKGEVPTDTIIIFDDIRLPSQIGDGVVTAAVPAELLAEPGKKQIYLEKRSAEKIERSNTVILDISQG